MSQLLPFDLIVAGVGGQGSLFAAKIIAQAAFYQKTAVSVAETYGVAQRGGSVYSQIRLGYEVCGPMIPKGQCHLILGLEPIEALRRAADYLMPGGMVLLNSQVNLPLETKMGREPELDINTIQQQLVRLGAGQIFIVDALQLALEAGGAATANVVMLGALAAVGNWPLSYEALVQALQETVKPAYLAPNLLSLDRGRAYFCEVKQV